MGGKGRGEENRAAYQGFPPACELPRFKYTVVLLVIVSFPS